MKRIVMLMTLAALLVQPSLGLIPVAQAQGPVGEGEPGPDGMPGYPAPDKPIPHHEPGQPSRAGTYRTQVVRENELGTQEVVEISGVDAMAADGIDPLAGNYTLVNWDKVLFSSYEADSDFNLRTFEFIPPTLTTIPDSQFSIGNYERNDITAGDLNGDGQAEQIAAWISDTNRIYISMGEMPGSLGRTTSAPAAIAHSDGSLDLVVRGYDDALWHRLSSDGSSWSDWSDEAGGILLSAPAIVSPGDGQSSAFVIGTDNQVYGTDWQVNNRALMFDGVDDYVDLPDNFPNVTEFTFAAWVYWEGGAWWQRIFDFGQDTYSNMFLTPSNGTNMRFAITTGGGGSELRLNAPSPLPQNEWVHIAVTLNGSQGVLYINGSEVASSTTMSLTPQDVVGENTWLGRSQYAADPTFNGKIDEVAVFERALSEAEVSTIWRSGWDSESGQVLGLRMDENPAFHGTTLTDASGQGNHGTLYTSEGDTNKSIQVPSRWQLIEPKPADECDWTSLESWHGSTPEVPAPAAIARGSQLDLFRLGPDNTLCRKHSDDGINWGNWEKLGGMLASGPGAVSLRSDHMQVFARGVDEALWHCTYNGSWGWGPWQRLELDGMDEGVTIASAPTAVSSTSGQIRVYVRGSDNKPYWIEYSGSTWQESWNQGDGELASGLGAVWVTDHFELFAQKADGSLQQSSDGVTWNPWEGLPARMPNIDTGLTGYPWPADPDVRSRYHDVSLDIETGYFSGDGRQQIVLVYHKEPAGVTGDGLVGLALWEPWDSQPQIILSNPLEDWSCDDSGTRVVKITTGNFDGAGGDEIAAVFACGLAHYPTYHVEVFSVEPITDETGRCYEVQRMARSTEATPVAIDFISLEIEAGDFDGSGDDEIVVGSSWHHTGSYEDHHQLYRVYDLTGDQLEDSDWSAGTNSKFYINTSGRCWGQDTCDGGHFWLEQGLDLAVGNFDDDEADEFVTLLSAAGNYTYGQESGDYGDAQRHLLVFGFVLTSTNVLNSENWTVNGDDEENFRAWSFPPYPYDPIVQGRGAHLDRLVVGDLDRDTVDEVGHLHRVADDQHRLNIYKLNLDDPSEWFNPPPAASQTIAISSLNYPKMVAGDFTGESIRVGPPSYRVQNRVDTLVAHINMPPKHRDLVKDAEGNYQLIESPVGECSPSPDSPDCTHAKYAALDYQASEQTIATTRAYEISAGMENEVCAGGGLGGIAEVKACARTSLHTTHGTNFEKGTEEIESIGFRRKVIAANDDKVVYFGTPYGVWEYPVLSGATGEPSEDVHLTVAFPLISMTQYPDTSGGYYSGTCDETWYSAGHQPNNVWSYDPIGDVTFEDYDPDYELTYDAIEGDWAEGEITYEKLQSAFSSVSFAHSVSAGVETEVSGEAKLGFVNVSGSFKASVNGEYSQTGMETDKLTTSEETTFSYFFAPQPDSGKFTTRVIFYRAKDGYQVLNYQAEPGRAAIWQLYDRPDPAFILPWYGFPDPDHPQVPPCGEDQKLFSPNIVISPSHAELGETVTISATVRNFSGETARNVEVRFYQGDPANNIGIDQRTIPVLSRESGPETVSITWTAAGVGRQKIYAVIDPYDAIPEMHDEDDLINNNTAYGHIQLAATNFADMGLVAEQPPYDAIPYALGDPKPTASLYVPRASLDAVARFEVGGAEIGLPVEGRVFEVVAYQGSKYKMWSDPIADFDLKPGPDDPPAVIIVAYTEADISALAENDLKLYRLVGTEWTEATCPGYQIHRFPEKDLLAVPICQTGIFAFSDVAPGPILGPVAQFSATPLSGTAPLTVIFTDLSSHYPTSWSWDFGDGATSTAQNPTHTYSEPGTYDVSLTASNEADSNTHTRLSYINAYGMHADFMATPVWGSAPLTVTFTDLSVGIGIPGPTSWAWDFGDEATSEDQNPTHIYSQNGAYTVTLTVSNGDAFDTKVDQNFVTVTDVTLVYLPLISKNQQ
jgi:hypothetical protein